MSYQDYEIEISQSQLSEIFSKLEGMCLLGGWAVYITVNKDFNDSQGRNYIGSRDIDLGFHIDKRWSEPQLKDSLFARTIRHLEGCGFSRSQSDNGVGKKAIFCVPGLDKNKVTTRKDSE